MAQHKLLLGSAAIAIALSGIATSRADSILVCDNTNNASEMLAVRYIHSPTRALFDISFKAPANQSLQARQELEDTRDPAEHCGAALDEGHPDESGHRVDDLHRDAAERGR